ncbi:MAG: hypothetical protein LBJ00_00865 [Planctomycetaceae bacterium]|nr:hypothetical protein [Planctomycetaceae bacterium]
MKRLFRGDAYRPYRFGIRSIFCLFTVCLRIAGIAQLLQCPKMFSQLRFWVWAINKFVKLCKGSKFPMWLLAQSIGVKLRQLYRLL